MYKSYENVSFCYCTEINNIFLLISKRCTKKYVYEVDEELGGGELSLFACPGWGIDYQERKSLQIPRGMPGGGMVTGQIEPCIYLACDKFPTQAFNRTFQICNAIVFRGEKLFYLTVLMNEFRTIPL